MSTGASALDVDSEELLASSSSPADDPTLVAFGHDAAVGAIPRIVLRDATARDDQHREARGGTHAYGVEVVRRGATASGRRRSRRRPMLGRVGARTAVEKPQCSLAREWPFDHKEGATCGVPGKP
jgi:hypothetical protein